MIKMRRINLGAGKKQLDGFVNLDKKDLDLNKFPYKYPDEYAGIILMDHVVEHLDNPFDTIMECWRILKKDGKLIVKMPTRNYSIAHKRFINGINTMYNFDIRNNEENLQEKNLFQIKVRMRTRGLKRVLYQLYKELLTLIYTEVEYEMVKKHK